METVTYVDGCKIKVRLDGYIVLDTVHTFLYKRYKYNYIQWINGKSTTRFIENLAHELGLPGNDKGFAGIYRSNVWDQHSAANGVLEYYQNDGEGKKIIFIHKKLAHYYTVSKNPIFASWLMDIANRYSNENLTLAKEVKEVHDGNTNQVLLATVTSVQPAIDSDEEIKQKFDIPSKENQILISKNEESINERKRKFEDIEYESKVAELNKLKEETKKLNIENRERETKLIIDVFNDYKLVMNNPSEMEQLHLRDIEKHIFNYNLNSTMKGLVPIITQESIQLPTQLTVQDTNEISIPLICHSMKLKPNEEDYEKIEKIVSKLYQKRYPNTPYPAKQKKFFDGRVIKMNMYCKKYRDILEKAINQYFNKSL
jgi:hypothetical protein